MLLPLRQRLLIAFLLSLLGGLFFSGLGVREVLKTRTLITTYPTAQAEVTSVCWDEVGGQKNKRWTCVTEYSYCVNGRAYSGATDCFTEFDEPTQGDRIAVYYNPRAPKESYANHPIELWLTPAVLLVFFGLCPLLLSGYFYARYRHTEQ